MAIYIFSKSIDNLLLRRKASDVEICEFGSMSSFAPSPQGFIKFRVIFSVISDVIHLAVSR